MRLGATAIVLFLAVASGIAIGAQGDAEPMREEDVVRLLVGGASVAEVISEIERRPSAYVLSEEIVEELRVAGIPALVIDAMQRRKAASSPPQEEDEVESTVVPPSGLPRLEVLLNPDREGGGGTLRLAGKVDFRLREAWRLDASLEGAPFEDVGVYLICRSATHVPDHWRSHTPLGRDFVSVPRHRMLAFVAGASRKEGSEASPLVLELPERLETEFETTPPHDLSLGIAIQVGGRYYRWGDDPWDDWTGFDRVSTLAAEVRSGKSGEPATLEVRFDRTPSTP